MPLYEIVKADGTREKVEADVAIHHYEGALTMQAERHLAPICEYAPGTWLEVWRREGVGE